MYLVAKDYLQSQYNWQAYPKASLPTFSAKTDVSHDSQIIRTWNNRVYQLVESSQSQQSEGEEYRL